MAQLTGRGRYVVDPSMPSYCEYVGPTGDTTTADSLASRAVAAVLSENLDEREYDLDGDGNVIEGLKRSATNDVQLQLMHETMRETSIIRVLSVTRRSLTSLLSGQSESQSTATTQPCSNS
jgi:hypothetical protein